MPTDDDLPEQKFWLHVPLESIRGKWLQVPSDGSLKVLGYQARLKERALHNVPLGSMDRSVIRQWLLFDPLPEQDAICLFEELRLRLQVLSLRQETILTVPNRKLQKVPSEHGGIFNGPSPSLIPAEFSPNPVWADGQSTSYLDGASTLGSFLDTCPAVKDERIRAAIGLAISSRYDTLPRSVFLSQLTIIDSLAVHSDRPCNICDWINEKIKEARNLKDQGLVTSLGDLKKGSHGTAIRNLVGRAGRAMGEEEAETESRQKLATKLYGVRSTLSHSRQDTLISEDVEAARQLARFIIDAAIEYPCILDGEKCRAEPAGKGERSLFREAR